MKSSLHKNSTVTPLQAKPKNGASVVPPASGLTFIDNASVQRKENKTGMPDQLKSGVESLSGIDMSDVKVHYNSSQPAQLNAHAYAQGNQIHIAAGQEKHLAHEAWHVVQQKQGRVQPTKQLKGKVNVNDDVALEKEADVMGAKAKGTHQFYAHKSTINQTVSHKLIQRRHSDIIQMVLGFVDSGRLRVSHPLSPVLTHWVVYSPVASYQQAEAVLEIAQFMPAPNAASVTLIYNLLHAIGGGNAAAANLNLAKFLITGAGGAVANLLQLTTLINHITPANAHLLISLMPLAGAPPNFVALGNLIQAAQANGARIDLLQNLIQSEANNNMAALEQLYNDGLQTTQISAMLRIEPDATIIHGYTQNANANFTAAHLQFSSAEGGNVGSIYFTNGRIRLIHSSGPQISVHPGVLRETVVNHAGYAAFLAAQRRNNNARRVWIAANGGTVAAAAGQPGPLVERMPGGGIFHFSRGTPIAAPLLTDLEINILYHIANMGNNSLLAKWMATMPNLHGIPMH